MANKVMTKTPMPEQPADVRNRNFDEVALGYTDEMAQSEAERCLQCKNKPCVEGCPVNVRIPEFILQVAEGDLAQAYDILTSTNSLPAICGRVCPQENQCEKYCVRGKKGEPVGIGRLERYVADTAMERGFTNGTATNNKTSDNAEHNDTAPNSLPTKGEASGTANAANADANAGVKVAVVGSGPAGLTCAGDLAKLGYKVTMFEALHTPGGVLVYGIPEFRLPKALVRREIAQIEGLGVELKTNTVIGKTFLLDELFEEGYEAVFIGSGAGLPTFMRIPGENLNGVYSANEFLTRTNLMKAYSFPSSDTPIKIGKSVAVVGGGNVAMDSARCAKRLGAENVYIVYRRSEAEMPARAEEVEHAKEEGIEFHLLCNPTAILGDEDGNVCGMELIEMELGEPDASGRRRPVPKEGSEYKLELQTAVIAVGTSPNPLIKATTPGLDTHKWGGIVADEEGATSRPGVFAGGDAVTGAATVIEAMGAGKRAAAAMHAYLQTK